MHLTPADIHNMVFGKSALGKRGYDEEEVDAFLDEATHEMIRLIEENGRLRERSGAARPPEADPGRLSSPAAGELAAADQLAAVGRELARARRAFEAADRHARETRDQLNEARRAAAAIPAEPGPDLSRVLSMAQRTADDYLRDANEESSSLVAGAREQSEQLIRESEQRAAAIESDSRRDHDRSLAGTEDNRRRVVQEIEDLTEMAGQYRTALLDHIDRQRRLLEGTD